MTKHITHKQIIQHKTAQNSTKHKLRKGKKGKGCTSKKNKKTKKRMDQQTR